MTIYPREYGKDLQHTMGIRLSPELRNEAEEAAHNQGMCFSTFLRQALRRNILLAKQIEKEVVQRNFQSAAGKSP